MQHTATHPANRIALLFFLTLHFLFLLTSSGRVRTMDEVSLNFQVQSLAQHGSTAVPQAVSGGLFFGKLDRSGQPQTPYSPGQAAAVVPWYALGSALLSVLPGVPPWSKEFVMTAVLLASNAAFSALAAALLFLIFCRLGIALRTALAAATLFALATPVFPYSAWFYSEPLAAALLLAAALFLFASGESAGISAKNAALAGLILGITLWVRPVHVFAAAIFLLAVFVREKKNGLRPAFVLATVIGLFGVACLARNHMLFGNFLDFGYPPVADGKVLNKFDTPILKGLYIFLFSPGKSMLLFAPPLLLAIPGIFRLAKRDRGLATIATLLPLAYLFFYAHFSHLEGGYSYGPRYQVPGIVMLCLGLGPALADFAPRLRKLAIVLFLAGFLIQVIGISTSFLEDQATGRYFDEHWTYRPSYSPIPSMSRRLLYYIRSPKPAPMGLGFDRWFVFLAKTGVARSTLAAGVSFEFTGLLFCAWFLRRALLHLPAP